MKNKIIIITETVNQCIDLHRHLGRKEFEKDFTKQYALDPKIYNTIWYWWLDSKNNDLAGNGGSGALETAVRLNPGAAIYNVKDFLKTKIGVSKS